MEEIRGPTYQEGEAYLSSACVLPDQSFNLLDWWKANESSYPRLSQVAKDILAIPIAQVSVERVFNIAKDLISTHRHRLAAQKIQKIMVLKLLISQEMDISSIDTEVEDSGELGDGFSDLFELPANTEYESEDQSIVEQAENEASEEDLPLPPRKRRRPARYCDNEP